MCLGRGSQIIIMNIATLSLKEKKLSQLKHLKVCGMLQASYQFEQSGTTDIMDMACNTYLSDEDEAFTLEYAWQWLKDEPKWMNSSEQSQSKKTKAFCL